ncbi:MAG: translation initiation factor IF-3 [Alphaproteobacteria bacterium]|nr:translation initiation factor IF-3 [Alphaproteobacteria bacterium]
MNEYITARSVNLIDNSGRNVGILPLAQALEMARNAGLDLVEMGGTQTPPTVKIMDYSRFKYEQKKKQSEAKKNQKQTELKEIWIKPLIDTHDFEIKMKKAIEFLADGHKVKISLWGRGDKRALKNKDLVNDIARRITESLSDKATIDAGRDGKFNSNSLLATPKK